ncbi:hypothetical protein [Paenibacillus guangzhouensis]|uniref:hypothetical protein n=1 Tax=Paenibacillus guangzhouensis TaxID=1473112 RepID=UPI001266DFD2|nr:hypothetical protein [Paenibacillus guangzhouensis]
MEILRFMMVTSIIPGNSAKADEVSVFVTNDQLHISRNQLVNQAGEPIQLKGMSSQGLQWFK